MAARYFTPFFVTLLFSISSYAQNESALIRNIVDLSRQIRQSAPESTASRASLLEARDLMEQALTLIEDGSHYDQSCFNFAYEKYSVNHISSVATDKAIAACKKIADLKVATFAYEKYYTSHISSTAMDKAADASGPALKGKLDMLQFAYEKYYTSHIASTAMDKAAQGIAQVPRGSLSCLQDLYNRYYGGHTASVAMDKTIAACSR